MNFLSSSKLAVAIAVLVAAGAAAAEDILVYSDDSADPWNRLHAAMLSRQINVRETAALGAADSMFAYRTMGYPSGLMVTSSVDTVFESGDRGAEPMAPTTLPSRGLRAALAGDRYDRFLAALQDAASDNRPRSERARALLQGDLWATFDFLYQTQIGPADTLRSRAQSLLPLIANMIAKVALTQQAIGGLPDLYTRATQQGLIPDFRSDRGWVAVEAMHPRGHESVMNNRRVTYVFVLLESAPRRKASIRDLEEWGVGPDDIQAAALVLRNLLIAADGKIVASPITQAIQMRHFNRDGAGDLRTKLQQFDLSRSILLGSPDGSGLVETDSTNVYLPFSGNDFGFATPHRGYPIRSTLRQKCGVCHTFPDASRFFSLHEPHFGTSRHPFSYEKDRAEMIVELKTVSSEFEELMQQWKASAN